MVWRPPTLRMRAGGHERASAASRSAIAGIASAATLAKAKRRKASCPPPNMLPGRQQDVLLVGEAPRHRRRRAAVEGVTDIGEIGAGAHQLVADVVAAEGIAQGREAVAHHRGVGATPVAERAQAVDRRRLADARRADGDRIHGLGDLGAEPRTAGDGADAVAGEAEDLREAVEMDQRLGPGGIAEQVVRCRVARQEITVGLVDDERETMGPGQARRRPRWRRADRRRRSGCWA